MLVRGRVRVAGHLLLGDSFLLPKLGPSVLEPNLEWQDFMFISKRSLDEATQSGVVANKVIGEEHSNIPHF